MQMLYILLDLDDKILKCKNKVLSDKHNFSVLYFSSICGLMDFHGEKMVWASKVQVENAVL
jgi:hypothetical protein